jgi:hypothetical protein
MAPLPFRASPPVKILPILRLQENYRSTRVFRKIKCASFTIMEVISMYTAATLRRFPLHHSICFPKHLEIFIGHLGLLAFIFCPTVVAQERNGWELGSLRGNSNVSQLDAQQVYEVLLKCWIAGMPTISRAIWRCIGDRRNCWWSWIPSSLTAGSNCMILTSGYPDRNAMGFIEPKRIQVKLLKPDLALALTWWAVSFPSSKQKMVGNSTMNLQKFNDIWKIVASHTSIAEM